MKQTPPAIVLLEARMNSELANLVRRHGGEPVSVPALRETIMDCGPEVATLLDALRAGTIDYILFQTGVGVMTLLNEAEKAGRRDELLAGLQTTTIIARGPKPMAVLSRNGLPAHITVASPFTTNELITALQSHDLAGKTMAVLHYGERNAALSAHLSARGARLRELCLYEWQLPEDTARLRQLVDELIARRYTAIAFTSQIQARHLFQLAAEEDKAEALRQALLDGIIVASIGPTCSAVLRDLGVSPQVEPENPKMGPLVLALMSRLTTTGHP
ncbi:MAG: uroporphyrinogen-III synthase [Blastocatellia bacterium]